MEELSEETKVNLKLMQVEVLTNQRKLEMSRHEKTLIKKEMKEGKE